MVRSAGPFTPSSNFPDTDPESLAVQACDDADSLREVLRAYGCLETLIAPLEVSDTEQLDTTRSELGALLRMINDELSRRIESVDKTVHAIRAVLDPHLVAPGPSSPSA